MIKKLAAAVRAHSQSHWRGQNVRGTWPVTWFSATGHMIFCSLKKKEQGQTLVLDASLKWLIAKLWHRHLLLCQSG